MTLRKDTPNLLVHLSHRISFVFLLLNLGNISNYVVSMAYVTNAKTKQFTKGQKGCVDTTVIVSACNIDVRMCYFNVPQISIFSFLRHNVIRTGAIKSKQKTSINLFILKISSVSKVVCNKVET